MRRAVIFVCLSVSLVFVGSPHAGAARATFRVETAVLQNARAASSQDSNADGTRDVRCPTNSYAFALSAYGATWGTYPALEAVGLWCKKPDGAELTPVSYGSASAGFPSLPTLGGGRCDGSPGAFNGVQVNFDRYLKDLKARCAVIVVDAKANVADAGLQTSWMLNQVERNDSKTELRCRAGQVLTGLRVRFRKDSNETAFTRLQAYCSMVRKA